MKFHILTAISRPENLSTIAESISVASQTTPGVEIVWHWRFDIEREHVGGQALKNAMLDEINDGWVVILDDDTLMHEGFIRSVDGIVNAHPDLSGIIVSQRRTTGQILVAAPENVVVSSIDAGQAVLRRDLIADHRLPNSYAGDGLWLEKILHGREDVIYVPHILSLHNAISGIDISETPERMRA